ncbi:MAG: pentapeptide repeat-containing protein [Phormidesmis sp.]
MRTTFTQKLAQRIQTGAFALIVIATPALAEPPMQLPTPTQQANVQRLVLTNRCMACDLTGADLTETHLIGADLRNANLQWADLTDANLEGADLEGADLTGANLTGAYLTDAYLANTQLVGVNFTNAHLYNVDLTGATMADINLAGAEVFNTPISVGGEEALEGELQPLEPIPLDQTGPLFEQ